MKRGIFLKCRRWELGLLPKDVARKIGVCLATLYNLEAGRVLSISPKADEKLMKLLKIKIIYEKDGDVKTYIETK